jgi:hypothetical protein
MPSSSGSNPLILKMKGQQSLERRLLFTSLQRVNILADLNVLVSLM